MIEKISEFDKIATIVLVVYTITAGLYIIFRNLKKERILSIDEINFILSQGDSEDPLNTQLPIHEESKLIEKSYGFYATREQFNNLSVILKPKEFKLTELRKIKRYIQFDGDKPLIKMESVDYFIFYLNVFIILFSSFVAIYQFYKYIREDWAVLIFLPSTALIFILLHFFLGPYWQAKIVKKILAEKKEPK